MKLNSLIKQRKYLEEIARDLKIRSQSDWYKLSYLDFTSSNPSASRFLAVHYGDSHIKAITTLYPEFIWKPWNFSSVPSGFWNEITNQKAFLLDLKEKLGITSNESWFKLNRSNFRDNGGSTLYDRYDGNVKKMLEFVFPEENWEYDYQFWRDLIEPRKLMDTLAKRLNIVHYEDWYKIRSSDLLKVGGERILKVYNGSHINALLNIYSEIPWKIHRFNVVPDGHWDLLSNQLQFFNDLEKELHINHWEDWYKVTSEDIEKRGGAGLLSKYGGSHTKALFSLYPQYPWSTWKFLQVPSGYWIDPKNQRNFFEGISESLGIKTLDDWYTITMSDIIRQGGSALLHLYGGSLIDALRSAFPEHNWRSNSNTHLKKESKAHSHLFSLLRDLFPNIDIHTNHLFVHSDVQFSKSNRTMELDIYIPSLHLGFEYQGSQHFDDKFHLFDSKLHERDKEKREKLESIGITLIEIPYYWDGTKNSLISTIHKFRPDLVKKNLEAEEIITDPLRTLNKSSKWTL